MDLVTNTFVSVKYDALELAVEVDVELVRIALVHGLNHFSKEFFLIFKKVVIRHCDAPNSMQTQPLFAVSRNIQLRRRRFQVLDAHLAGQRLHHRH